MSIIEKDYNFIEFISELKKGVDEYGISVETITTNIAIKACIFENAKNIIIISPNMRMSKKVANQLQTNLNLESSYFKNITVLKSNTEECLIRIDNLIKNNEESDYKDIQFRYIFKRDCFNELRGYGAEIDLIIFVSIEQENNNEEELIKLYFRNPTNVIKLDRTSHYSFITKEIDKQEQEKMKLIFLNK